MCLQKTTHNYPILGGHWPISGNFHHFPTLIHNCHFHWSFLIGCYSETQVGYLLWGAQTHSSNTCLSLSEICFLHFFLLSRLWTLSDGDRNLEIMIRHLELISIPGASSSFTTSDIITRKWQRRHRRPRIKVKWAGKPYRQVPSIFSLNQVESHGRLSTHWHLIAYCFYFPSWLGAQPGPSCVLGSALPWSYTACWLLPYSDVLPHYPWARWSSTGQDSIIFPIPFSPLPMGSLIYGRVPDNSLLPQISCIFLASFHASFHCRWKRGLLNITW